LIRAVRARRAALLEWLTGFEAFLAVVLAGFDAFVLAVAGLLVFCAGFPAAFFAVEEPEPAGAVVEPPFVDPLVDCAATGRTTISQDNRTARLGKASRGWGLGDFINLISTL
jgi:hypothetical protein